MTAKLTPKAVAYMGTEEGLVAEAYLDSKRIWTWAMGVATTGGHNVLQYKDNPQPLDVALKASIALMQATYLPAVAKAFAGHELLEHQVAAALSFQWRNGTILSAQWVKDYQCGDIAAAQRNFMQWTDHGRQIPRATRERDLFFSAIWPSDMRTPVYPVSKPSYAPIFNKGARTDLMPILQQILGGR